MKISNWSNIMIGIEEKVVKDSLWAIYMECKKIQKGMGKVRENIKGGKEEVNYSVFMDIVDRFKYVLNVYNNLVGNIVYSSGDEKAIENFNKDIKTINQRIDMETSMEQRKQPNKTITMVFIYNEMSNILQYIYLMLNDCKPDNFRNSLVDNMRLMGGLLEKKTQMYPPQPSEGLSTVESEKKPEKKEEPKEDSGLDEWREIVEKREKEGG